MRSLAKGKGSSTSLAIFANVLFDTNIYLRVLHSEVYERRHRERFVRFAPRTYLCSVVAAELYAGAHTVQNIRLVDHLLAPYLRVGRLVFPHHNDWINMGKVAARILRTAPSYRSKLPALQNDILIALSAKRVGATVVSENKEDFILIQRFVSFFLFPLLPPAHSL
jgi:tRNA(fMet)-specific endonuclease VapC